MVADNRRKVTKEISCSAESRATVTQSRGCSTGRPHGLLFPQQPHPTRVLSKCLKLFITHTSKSSRIFFPQIELPNDMFDMLLFCVINVEITT